MHAPEFIAKDKGSIFHPNCYQTFLDDVIGVFKAFVKLMDVIYCLTNKK